MIRMGLALFHVVRREYRSEKEPGPMFAAHEIGVLSLPPQPNLLGPGFFKDRGRIDHDEMRCLATRILSRLWCHTTR